MAKPTREQYALVTDAALPEVLQQVLRVKTGLEAGHYSSINQACKAVGLSRSSYYKYRNQVHHSNVVAQRRLLELAVQCSSAHAQLIEILRRAERYGLPLRTLQEVPLRDSAWRLELQFEVAIEGVRLINFIDEIKTLDDVLLEQAEVLEL